MVVDDLPENRQVLARMLSNIGCDIQIAESGEEALRMIEQAAPDIVFLDMLMPGMDGMETARQIRRRLGDSVRLVATSASAFTHEQEGFRAAGFEDVVSKPVRCPQLYRSLSTLLGVKFHYAVELLPENEDFPEFVDHAIPDQLRERMAAAAELYSVTELRQCIDEVESVHSCDRRLGTLLRRCVHNYDMGGILRLLNIPADEKHVGDFVQSRI
jgi:CheY-like chemotaxis protein